MCTDGANVRFAQFASVSRHPAAVAASEFWRSRCYWPDDGPLRATTQPHEVGIAQQQGLIPA